MMQSTPMEDAEFHLLRDLIRDQTGIYYADENSFLLQRRLQTRLEALQLPRFRDYYDYLASPELSDVARARELDEICESIVTRETYLFREGFQLDAFRDALLPQLHHERRRGKRISIWSAGCSTGEEPYTIAILILESGLFPDWEVRIVGSDLSPSALSIATAAVYGPASFRQADPRLIERYFHEVRGGRRANEAVRRLVSFSRVNLQQRSWIVPAEPFDAIFCRNVLIYFDRALRSQVIYRFADKLVPGGHLLLGHSESLLDNTSPFELCHLKRQLVYRKPV